MHFPTKVLDDNRELFIPETRETVKAHSHFLLFGTQNPPGLYGGRKVSGRHIPLVMNLCNHLYTYIVLSMYCVSRCCLVHSVIDSLSCTMMTFLLGSW